MGALIVAEGNNEGLPCGSIAEKIYASDPVVYQLVRVEGDGRLVPATDDELMEVEHLLEDDKSKVHLTEAIKLSAQCPSNEGFPSNMSDLEGPEGLEKSENLEVDPPTSDATNENFVSMEGDRRDLPTSNSEEERDQEHEKMDHAGDNSDANADILQTVETGNKRKHHRAWTLCEVLKLVEGVARYGAGRWSEIRRVSFASYSYRTSVDLKDKWRNLLRASFAQEPSEKGARNLRKPTSMPIPTPILLRVRELAEMHSPAGIELRPSKFSGHDRKIVQEKEPGFL